MSVLSVVMNKACNSGNENTPISNFEKSHESWRSDFFESQIKDNIYGKHNVHLELSSCSPQLKLPTMQGLGPTMKKTVKKR